jgi:putative glutamine amidotransferase
MQQKIVVGVTDCSKYLKYSNWILGDSKFVEVIPLTNNIEEIKKCNGVLLTGGEDVHPKFYGKPELYKYCYKTDINEARDEFELNMLQYTEANNIPVLGICRGLQIANVFFGGTLIPDIPTWGKFNHSKMPDDTDRYHKIIVDPTSWISTLVCAKEGVVNSNHHQSADIIGDGLIVSALAADGVVEALERKNPKEKSFLCLVQWHPERMNDAENNFAKNIRQAFIQACI